jgi:hypothetical protein
MSSLLFSFIASFTIDSRIVWISEAQVTRLSFLTNLYLDREQMLGESLDHRAVRDRFSPFEVVNRTPEDSVLGDALDVILFAVVVRVNLGHDSEPDFLRELAPLGDLAHVTREDDDVRGRFADRFVLNGGDASDVDERQLQRAVADGIRNPLHELRRELGLVGRLARRRKLGVVVHSFLEPRTFAIGASGDHIRIHRVAGDCANGLLQPFAHTTLTRPWRPGEDNLFHDHLHADVVEKTQSAHQTILMCPIKRRSKQPSELLHNHCATAFYFPVAGGRLILTGVPGTEPLLICTQTNPSRDTCTQVFPPWVQEVAIAACLAASVSLLCWSFRSRLSARHTRPTKKTIIPSPLSVAICFSVSILISIPLSSPSPVFEWTLLVWGSCIQDSVFYKYVQNRILDRGEKNIMVVLPTCIYTVARGQYVYAGRVL